MVPSPIRFRPSRLHETLGTSFFDPVEAARFPAHVLRFRNDAAAATIGLAELDDTAWVAHFGRFEPLPGSLRQPLALRYHGHQFRHYNPELGDGRGFLFAQMWDEHGRLLDLGTKGSGRTPWSRTADGRLTLKGGVREVLATAQLEALGVDTSRSFSLIETGEALERGDEPSPTRSAVLVRLSHSHVRIGTFQRLAYLGEEEAIRRLVDYCQQHYLPEAGPSEDEAGRAVAFLQAVCARVARTGAQWMAVGFVHGVLNTDNINITGESFDYGPWRFLPEYRPEFTAAYFDTGRLYAFGRQPDTLLWNLVRLAETLLPMTEPAALEGVLAGFGERFQAEMAAALLRRLGRAPAGADADSRLVQAVWLALRESLVPFERFFFDTYATLPEASAYPGEAFDAVRRELGARPLAEGAGRDHPYFADPGPCTLLIDEVEAIWAPIAERDDWSVLEAKLAAIRRMASAYAAPAAGSGISRPPSPP